MASDNRTEKATPRRRQKARERGQIARSREVSSAVGILGIVLLLKWVVPGWAGQWREMYGRYLESATAGGVGPGEQLLTGVGMLTLRWAGPVLLVVWVLAIIGMTMQGGIVFSAESLQPNWGRMNPAHNVKQLFSLSGASRLLKSVVPLGVLGYLGVSIFLRDWEAIERSSWMNVGEVLGWALERCFEFGWKAGLVLLAWSGLDYVLQRAHMERGMRMTKQEVRDESKEVEGHPSIRARIRRVQREMRRWRMLQNVPEATVILTNPTEYAVALQYRPETMTEPVLVAKGANLLAQKIKQMGRRHGVPVMENPPLARSLYKGVEVGQDIPAGLYTAVAEILAFIHRKQSRVQGAGPKTRQGSGPTALKNDTGRRATR